MTEFELIQRYFTHRPSRSVLGVGDDAALVRVGSGMELAVSTDMLLEGRHFLRGADPALLGHKSLAVNLSDMAAMGAKPRWATLAIALPRARPEWVSAFAHGFMRLARKYDVDLIGGDTTRGPLSICVQIMGELPKGAALRRDGAKAGDDVWVSGELGGAALGLAGLQRRLRIPQSERRALEQRLDRPEPRVALGLALRRIAHAAIDVSDGFVADLGHICERSNVSATVHWESLPASPVARRLAQTSDVAARAILAGGDDYELCFTAPPSRRANVARAATRARTPVAMVGRIEARGRAAPLVQVLDSIGRPFRVRAGGFDHFR